MVRSHTRSELLAGAAFTVAHIRDLIALMDEDEQRATFPHSVRLMGSEAHWARDLNLRDVLVHLHEWHRLFLRWVAANQAGEEQTFLPAPYNWRNYGALNAEFWRRHQQTSYEDATRLFNDSHSQVVALIYSLPDIELSSPAFFPWTGEASLGAYCELVTSHHYEWAIKKIKAYAIAAGKVEA